MGKGTGSKSHMNNSIRMILAREKCQNSLCTPKEIIVMISWPGAGMGMGVGSGGREGRMALNEV